MSRIQQGPTLTLRVADARALYQAAKLRDLRHRVPRDTALYALLTDITALAYSDAAPGTPTRHETASEEREMWTIQQLARAAGLSTRKVRLDAQRGDIPATKAGTGWIITHDNAQTYLNNRRKP